MKENCVASSSAHDARNSRRQLRQRADKTAYSMPGIQSPRLAICDCHGPTLEPALIPLARALFEFDLKLLLRIYKYDRKQGSSTAEESKLEVARRIQEYIEVKRQWKDIESSRCSFSQSYLQNKTFGAVWAEGLRIVREALRSNNATANQTKKRSDFKYILRDYENLACNLRDQMIHAAHQDLLENDIFYSIQERWVRLDEILDWYYRLLNLDIDKEQPEVSREAPKWQNVRCLLQVNGQVGSGGKEHSRSKLNDRSKKTTQPGDMTGIFGGKMDGAFILWSALFCCTVSSIAIFALGYAHSAHHPGTTNDADFWFLIQSTVMQLLGLVASALLEWKSGGLSAWRWVLPIAISGASSISSVPLYLIIPTEWSSFLSLFAGATQSFLILQHLMS